MLYGCNRNLGSNNDNASSVIVLITSSWLSGNFLTKSVGGSENSVAFSDLESSEWYGAYVEAQTRSGITSRSLFVKGGPFRHGKNI